MNYLGVIGTSKKEDERRLPIHPDHLFRLPLAVRKKLIFEKGYGIPFNKSDEEMETHSGGVAKRSELLSEIGSVVSKTVLGIGVT